MHKLPISVGILAWRSGQTLVDTLTTYHNNGLLELIDEVTILFQEVTETDKDIANHFNIPYIGMDRNIGIGNGFIRLAQTGTHPYFLTLEHDWNLVEDIKTTHDRLLSGTSLLDSGVHSVRYRHRKHPGFPLFTSQYQGMELEYYDGEIELTSPHLLDAIHWTDSPESVFSEYIRKQGEYHITTSRYGNWTNNPCMYSRQFYIDIVSNFAGEGIDLEGNISRWWARQPFTVAHGEGLFTHKDINKYGR